MTRPWWGAAAAVPLCAFVLACGGGGDTVTGVVVDVTGDITTVERFVMRLPDGTDRELQPAPGITFHGGAAIGHLIDHLRSGEPVEIRYEQLDDGTWVALEVADA